MIKKQIDTANNGDGNFNNLEQFEFEIILFLFFFFGSFRFFNL